MITRTEQQDQFNNDSIVNETSRHDKNPRTLQDQNTDWLSYLLIMDQLYEFGLADRKAPRIRHRKDLLNMEQLHEYGLAKIPKAPRTRYGKVWWFPPAQSHIAIIPKRELDDPPDLDEATNSFWDLIVKLSKNNNEDDLSR